MYRGNNMKSKVILTVIVALIMTLAGNAQTDQGRISGQVTDQTGAVVPGATVTVTNNGTKQERTVTANDDGFYSVTGLRAATYTIVANSSTNPYCGNVTRLPSTSG